jgi:hypothetical protein
MPDVGFLDLFAVALVAFGVPLLLGLAPWLRVLSPVTAAALVTAGLLSVLLFPATALILLRTPGPEYAAAQRPPRSEISSKA